MSNAIIPLDDFLQLETEEQVEKLKRWKMDYTLKDIRDAWGFKHSAQYYMLLKKLRIYERVVNKSDKFFPGEAVSQHTYGGERFAAPAYAAAKQPGDHFSYHLNVTLSGNELAEKLERAAQFLKGENKQVTVKLAIETIAVVETPEQSEEKVAEQA
ncbi:conserved hypothetical protein [Paenibacillus curdlanolyticus YK9]|uniref:Uncharacterized protein n=1 Tax=Paenibacillus curdlanolyticus YK9 TaxID=717606 RepID=E0I9U3_9BACL|nr:hypothetical protein [Paenibacillus curdlanolyticus]EFM10520.1 conserved hypothetical protein [Paenibacillus curdlanolyticus YK9]